MFNADDVKTVPVPPVLKKHTTALQRMQYHCVSDEERRLHDCVYLYRLTKH